MFKGLNVNYDSEIINTCGSGVTACAIDLALRLNGAKDIKLYDGSWSEYGAFDEPNFDE
jgi:thiosulfate/3-mercaptopyruvate sulfurtransferase